jgi:P-type Mg2+ transporter
MAQQPLPFWAIPTNQQLRQLDATARGLTSAAARERLVRSRPNRLTPRRRVNALVLLLAQFKSPIILLLLFAAGLSFALGERIDAIIILIILVASGLLSFWQEHGAADVVRRLLATIQTKATLQRDGVAVDVPLEQVVPGDCVVLNAGDVIPGDCRILESNNLFVDESALTGETYPVEKAAGVLAPETPLNHRTNALFLGTHVVSGTATALVVRTGKDTEFGQVSERLVLRPPETDFERGIRRFGTLLLEITLTLVLAIFAINVYFQRPVVDSFLFALALAVGLTPQLLPAIISIVLSQGAKRMAREQVIVKQLASIENFGSMNVLCSDKTGTLTEGLVRLHAAQDAAGHDSEAVLRYAYLNAVYETGFTNPIDAAIRAYRTFDVSAVRKLDEIPYDFLRKRLSILVEDDGQHVLITKGALANVLEVCTSVAMPDGSVVLIATQRAQIDQHFTDLSAQGFRVLGIATRIIDTPNICRSDEQSLTFLGFLVFFDPPKPGIAETLGQLRQLGISLKIITGDNRAVATALSQQIGIADPLVLSGPELRHTSNEALRRLVNDVAIFAEVEPNQKERIIIALKQAGNVVGYLGDGINDASALHAADVGISVDSAVDVAKEAAQIVLLKHDLGVLAQGVREGRTTFANTLKYVFVTTSANFGNMFSMAGVSLFLPFLPLLPKQILLTNFLTDIPAMTIATDSVDQELVERPRRWNIGFIRNFMLTFGLVSSVFDYLTFGLLLYVYHATIDQFRTGWFVESVMTELLIMLVIRTQKPFFQSRPGRYLAIATLIIAATTLLLPYSPFGALLGLTALPLSLLALIGGITLMYILTSELAKKLFYRHVAS